MFREVAIGASLVSCSLAIAGPSQDLYEIRATGLVATVGITGAPPPIFANAEIGQQWSYSFIYDASVPVINGQSFAVVSFSISLENENITVDNILPGNAYISASGFGGQDRITVLGVTNSPELTIISELLLVAPSGTIVNQFLSTGTFDPSRATSVDFVTLTNAARNFTGAATSITLNRVPAPAGFLILIASLPSAFVRRRRV